MTLNVMNDYVSEKTAADDLGVAVGTLRRWFTEHLGPPRVTIARRIFYRKAGIQEWLLAREQNPEAAIIAAGAMPGHAAGNGHAANGQGARE